MFGYWCQVKFAFKQRFYIVCGDTPNLQAYCFNSIDPKQCARSLASLLDFPATLVRIVKSNERLRLYRWTKLASSKRSSPEHRTCK